MKTSSLCQVKNIDRRSERVMDKTIAVCTFQLKTGRDYVKILTDRDHKYQ